MAILDCICPKNSKGIAILSARTLMCHLLAPAEDVRKKTDKNTLKHKAPRLRTGGIILPGENRRVYESRGELIVRNGDDELVGKIINKIFVPSSQK